MSKTLSRQMPDFVNRRAPFHFTTALNTLTKMGVDINQVDLLAVGEYENYKGEVLEQEPAPGEDIGPTTKITLKIGFPSAVDQMPYQFFYGMTGFRSSSGAWENAARCLLAPFDASVIRHLASTKLQDLRSNLGLAEYDQIKNFLGIFDFALDKETEDIRESVVWASVFPAFNQWSGNPVLVCRVFQALFGYEFRIRENTKAEHVMPESCRSRLGAATDRLGRGLILGKSFSDYDSGYELIISGVPMDDVPELRPGGRIRAKIERALSIFMPTNLEYKIRVKTRVAKTVIGKEEHKNYLGYTSYIGA